MNHRGNENQGPQTLCDPPRAAGARATTPASPLQWYGSLQSHARKIAAMLPPHNHYAEPFAGGLSVLLSKPISQREHIGDINADLINLWRVIQRPASRRSLIERVALTPYSRAVYGDCIAVLRNGGGGAVRRAWASVVTCKQGRNGLGAFASRWSHSKSGSNQHADSWANLPARLEQAGRRMRGVRIECAPYERMLERLDSPTAAMFLDPPYLSETRLKPKVFDHEFTDDDHMRLLRIVRGLKSAIAICGYRSSLYDEWLNDWKRTDFKGRSYAGIYTNGNGSRRTLSVWMNYAPPSK